MPYAAFRRNPSVGSRRRRCRSRGRSLGGGRRRRGATPDGGPQRRGNGDGGLRDREVLSLVGGAGHGASARALRVDGIALCLPELAFVVAGGG
jgi:hypothetical protein